ncbi:MAG: rhodanese-like domain-containing protein [Desulfuromonas sp.]|nr:MAG: rhodanese-like domain-containing protein [Desulfuromonas sp.]
MSRYGFRGLAAGRRLLLEVAVIGAAAMAIGLTVNYGMVMNAFSGKTVATPVVSPSQPEEVRFPDPVEMDEVRELLVDGALLIDARHQDDYRKAHIAGAVSLPLGTITEQLASFQAQVAKDRTLVAYCNGFGCPDSFDLGIILLKNGFQDVLVFEGGFPEWRDAGLPIEGEGQ